MPPFRIQVVAGIALWAMLSGCAQKQTWYQPGKGQVDYDQDAQECTLIASNFARQATMTGNSEDPTTYQQTMRNCLAAKGWSASSPAPNGDSPSAGTGSPDQPPLALIKGNTLHAFGSVITLPPSFHLVSTVNQGSGDTRGQNLTFAERQTTFITVMVQEMDGKANRFLPTPYPAQAPFFLYEQDPFPSADNTEHHWSIFCGTINNEWVMGLGSFLLINPRERITVIVTQPLPPPQTTPEAGFRLSRHQFATIDAFKKEWTTWLARQVVTPPPSWWSRLLPQQ